MSNLKWLTINDIDMLDLSNLSINANELFSYKSPVELNNRKIAGQFINNTLQALIAVKSLEIIPAWSISCIAIDNKLTYFSTKILLNLFDFVKSFLISNNIHDLYIVVDERRAKILNRYIIYQIQEIVPFDTVPKYSVHWKLMNYTLSKKSTYIIRTNLKALR